jgi:hypothetical protein
MKDDYTTDLENVNPSRVNRIGCFVSRGCWGSHWGVLDAVRPVDKSVYASTALSRRGQGDEGDGDLRGCVRVSAGGPHAVVSAAQRAVICTFEKTNPFFGGREGSWRKRRFLFYKCKSVTGSRCCCIQAGFPILGRAFAICVKKTGRRKRMKGGRARIDFVDRNWRRAHGFLFCFEYSAACQVFWAVSGAKWLILLGVDGCDSKSAETQEFAAGVMAG